MNRLVLRMAVSVNVALIAAMGTTSAAFAQSKAADSAAAQELFDTAKKLEKAKNYADACPKLEESQRLAPGNGTEFNLADCWEHIGRTASAWAEFIDVADQLKVAGQRDREKVARDRASALQPKLMRLSIVVPPELKVPGLELKRDGVVLRDAQWGVGVPVDAGKHVISASAPGSKPWETSADVAGEGKTTTVTMVKLEPADVAAPAAVTPPPATGTTTPAAPPPDAAPDSNRRTIGIVVAAVGVVGIGIGAGFGLRSMSKHSDYTSHCVNNVCDADGVSLHDSAVTAGTISTVAFGIGAVAVVGGGILFLTSPSPKKTGGLKVAPMIGMSTGGLSVKGAW